VTLPQDLPSPFDFITFGTKFEPPSVEKLQPHFADLEILSFIKHGGMGTYYKARHLKLDRLSAVKILPVNPETDAEFIANFKVAARAMARLNHTNIIGVYEFKETVSALFLVVEFVHGDIFERVIDSRTFELTEILAIITQVCSALNYAHSEGVIHRDLRPGNTLFNHDGQVKIGDFGLARLMGEELFRREMTANNLAMGTIDYVAPEQFEPGSVVDHRADIYSLGMMIYKLLTKTLPHGTFTLPSALVPNLDPRLDELVIRCLQRNPVNRFQHITEVWAEVDRILHT
jgi:eukaryotic-like serine/threonine-protein kinase